MLVRHETYEYDRSRPSSEWTKSKARVTVEEIEAPDPSPVDARLAELAAKSSLTDAEAREATLLRLKKDFGREGETVSR